MKKVINGKMYNTESAQLKGRISKGESFGYFMEELYQKKRANFLFTENPKNKTIKKERK